MPSPAERGLAREAAANRVKSQLPTLRTWSNDAQTIAATGGQPTQAQIRTLFDRFSKLCDAVHDLSTHMGIEE